MHLSTLRLVLSGGGIILAACPAFSVWAIKLLMLTGLRRDEILTLTWPMVDWQHACFHLPDTKTGQRSVLVSDEVLALLREIQEGTGHPSQGLVVRGRRGTKLTALNLTWARIRDEAGIPDVRLHDLRHSFASDALMAGAYRSERDAPPRAPHRA